jgi:hypothetical protein
MRIVLLPLLLLALTALAEPEPTNPFSAMFAPPTPAPSPSPAPPKPQPTEPVPAPRPEPRSEPAPMPAPSGPTLTFETPGIYLLRIKVGKVTGAAIVQVPEAGTFSVVVEATKR